MNQLAKTRQAAMLTAFHHTGEIVAPNGFLPAQYRLPSLKAAPRLLPLSDGDGAKRNAAVQAMARGALAARANRSFATRQYRLRHLQGFLEPNAFDKFQDSLDAHREISASVRVTAKADGLAPSLLQPDDTEKRIESIPGAEFVLSRNLIDQQPYLDLLASQINVPKGEFPILLHTHDAWPDLDSFITTVVIWLTISRRTFTNIDWLDHFGLFMDPANWATVNPEYFGGSAVIDSPQFPLLKKRDGTGWKGYLSEKVEWALNDTFSSSIHNRLKIDYSINRDDEELRVKYSLDESITSDVSDSLMNGGLDVDRGGVVMWPSKERDFFYVVATKQLRFVDRDAPILPGGVNVGQFLNFMAPASVGLWMDQLVFQTALKAVDDEAKRRAGGAIVVEDRGRVNGDLARKGVVDRFMGWLGLGPRRRRRVIPEKGANYGGPVSIPGGRAENGESVLARPDR